MMVFRNNNKGFSVFEIVIVLAILGFIGVAISTFQRGLFANSFYLQEQLSAQQEIRSALKLMSAEIRPAATANTGAYPIGIAEQDEFMFYTDTNDDAVYERIRYYINGTTLMRGELVPTGSPLTYTGNEETKILVHNLSTTTIFNYYDNTYTGSESALGFPINIVDIRMVEIAISVDENPNRTPGPSYGGSKIFIRSLKDNS